MVPYFKFLNSNPVNPSVRAVVGSSREFCPGPRPKVWHSNSLQTRKRGSGRCALLAVLTPKKKVWGLGYTGVSSQKKVLGIKWAEVLFVKGATRTIWGMKE